MNPIITVNNLIKSYGKQQAVKGITFSVRPGKLFAFLGPNGAGKSTTIDILCTLLNADQGEIRMDGHLLGKENNAIRRKIGVVFQDSILDPLLSVKENLITRARFYQLSGTRLKEAVANAAAATEATEYLNRPYGNLSGGQRRRADIARALLNTPKILFLDEPTTGLDPKTKESVWNTILSLQNNSGMTVFLTTHYMEEAAMADYIVLINKGIIAAEGTPYALKKTYSKDTLRIKSKNPEEISRLLKLADLDFTYKNGLFVAGLTDTIQAISLLEAAKYEIESFEVVHGSMNDVFLTITGGEDTNV